MEERYEIRGKIGQGGVGAVYRAYDTKMNREVAIKRLLADTDVSTDLQEQATRQLAKEAGALAALQHPHIVTVYDVGGDEDGPYVVMELISGKTLDELVERAPLTWSDFRELALQSQEALIAAQELNLVHRDLKPQNLMLSWLPSGKFQVKIVDFGLAKLTPKPSLQTLDQSDSVFGSIFFMAPEQFERVPLDIRTDMYAIGCVYYHALTGTYPFDGDSGPQVMASHLTHNVVPIQEKRPDLPRWACDWVMWHINRYVDDRPANAREALQIFLQNDSSSGAAGTATQAVDNSKRSRLIIPGAAAPQTATAPQPGLTAIPEPPQTQTAPQPLLPPDGAKRSVHTSPQSVHVTGPVPTTATGPHGVMHETSTVGTGTQAVAATAPATPASQVQISPTATFTPAKRGLSNVAKITLVAIMSILIIMLVVMLMKRGSQNKRDAEYNKLVALAADATAKEVPVTGRQLQILLEAAANVGKNEDRQTIYQALYLAEAKDRTNIDAKIAEFATTQPMQPDVREVLIRDVIRKRNNPEVVPTLMEFARNSKDVRAATAAIQATRHMATDEQFSAFLEIIRFTTEDGIRKAAEEALVEIIDKSNRHEALGSDLADAYASAVNDEVRYSLLRLLGRAGGSKADGVVQKALESSEKKDQLAAILALGNWVDDSKFPALIAFIESSEDPDLRPRAFDAAFRFLNNPDRKRDDSAKADLWQQLARNAKNSVDQQKVISGLASRESADWAIALVQGFANNGADDRAIDLAEKALSKMRGARSQ